MPFRPGITFVFILFFLKSNGQLPVARDTITVIGNGSAMKMPWAGGINSANISSMHINSDQNEDLVFFEKQNIYSIGIFRCFIHTGPKGSATYSAAPGLSYFFPEVSNWALLRDYDGDGKADIFASTTGGIKVYRNVGTAQWPVQFSLVSPLLYSNYYPDLSPPFNSNLFAGTAGPPGIADIDDDGDLDVLTFTPLGVFLELHRNMSMELYGHSDSLVFQRDDECWGGLAESDCSVDFETCSSRLQQPKNTLHAGACIACFDSDGDADKDLLMGDMNCRFVQYVHNTGTLANADFTDTTKMYPNFPQKNSDNNSIRISHFPCAYIVDADLDGRQDLIATPNAVSENINSVWFYRNTSNTGTVNFVLQKKNFIQDEMIDVGQNAFPLLFDENGDGLKDLLLGTQGYFDAGSLSGRLTLYRNTGSAAVPVFSLITRNFEGLSTKNLSNVMPAAGDVDGDGDEDICIGTSFGQIHWLENTAGPGNPPAYAPLKLNPFQFTTVSAVAAPQLFDLDEDGRNDLLIGMKNGRVAYYRNTTTSAQVSFSLVTSELGKVDTRGDATRWGFDGYAAPFFYRENGKTFLLAGSVSGRTLFYEVPDASSDFILLSSIVNGLNEGAQSVPWFEDINADGKRDLFLGNAAGGVTFFSSASPEVAIPELMENSAGLSFFPNPAEDLLSIKAAHPDAVISEIQIFNLLGEKAVVVKAQGQYSIDISSLQAGVYFVSAKIFTGGRVSVAGGRFVKR